MKLIPSKETWSVNSDDGKKFCLQVCSAKDKAWLKAGLEMGRDPAAVCSGQKYCIHVRNNSSDTKILY